MDTRKPRLIQAARELKRTVFASMPWGYRLAHLLFQLRMGGMAQDFGRTAYGIFLMEGVSGMPEAPFIPKNTREINRLPKGYGSEFGKHVESAARKFVKGAEADAEEILSKVWVKLLTSESLQTSFRGKPLDNAENIVLKVLKNEALDYLKYLNVRKHDDIEEMFTHPSGLTHLDDFIPESDQSKLFRYLGRYVSPQLAPDVPLYLKLLSEGYTNSEIAEDQLLPSLKTNPMSQQALGKYRQSLLEGLEKYLELSNRP